jgi:hypothetical protein
MPSSQSVDLRVQGKSSEMNAASFMIGMGPCVCLEKDIAIMELFKLLPEVCRVLRVVA